MAIRDSLGVHILFVLVIITVVCVMAFVYHDLKSGGIGAGAGIVAYLFATYATYHGEARVR